jgi:hypothetical protein
MEKYFSSPVLDVFLDRDIIVIRPNAIIGSLSYAEYDKATDDMLEGLKNLTHIRAVIDNAKESTLVIPVDKRAEVADKISRFFIDKGANKYATVIPEAWGGRLSYRQAAEELPSDTPLTVAYFDSYEEAEAWVQQPD